jgi:hypothetical protein
LAYIGSAYAVDKVSAVNPNVIPCCERRAEEGDRTANIPCDWGGGILKLMLKVPS